MQIKGFKTPVYAALHKGGCLENEIYSSFRSLRRYMNQNIKVEILPFEGVFYIVCEEHDRDAVQLAILKDNENHVWVFCTNW